jgi:hypothetical protein
MAPKIDVKAGALAIDLQTSGLVGGSHAILSTADGALSLRLPTMQGSPFGFLRPGDIALVTIGVVRIAVSAEPDTLPGLTPEQTRKLI